MTTNAKKIIEEQMYRYIPVSWHFFFLAATTRPYRSNTRSLIRITPVIESVRKHKYVYLCYAVCLYYVVSFFLQCTYRTHTHNCKMCTHNTRYVPTYTYAYTHSLYTHVYTPISTFTHSHACVTTLNMHTYTPILNHNPTFVCIHTILYAFLFSKPTQESLTILSCTMCPQICSNLLFLNDYVYIFVCTLKKLVRLGIVVV